MTSSATDTMQRLNPNRLWGRENGHEVFIEDWADPDGRMYRLEYQCDTNGRSATAYCRYNPWGSNPYPATQCHLYSSGQICLGSGTFDLETAVERARFWCTAYSVFRESGTFPNL